MQIPVLLDRSRREPLTSQLVDQLRDAIRHARIRPRHAAAVVAPSVRTAFGVAQYRHARLRHPDRRGLCRIPSGVGNLRRRKPAGIARRSHRRAARAGARRCAVAHADAAVAASCAEPSRSATQPAVVRFLSRPAERQPVSGEDVAAALANGAVSRRRRRGLSQYGDPAGLPALRSAIADHLATTRGIAADPGRIVIVNGAQEGISIAARLFLNHGTPSAIEDSLLQGAAFAFEATGSEIASVAVDFDGPDPGRIAASGRRRCSMSRHRINIRPANAFAASAVMPIVAWARRYGCYVLEDDRDGDLRYEGSPLQAIAATAPDCTIYLGTFSQYARRRVAARLHGRARRNSPTSIAAAKALLNNGNSWLEQAALAEMMRAGSYAAHLLRSRAHYKENRDYLLAALRRNFGDVSVTGEDRAVSISFGICRPGCPMPQSSKAWRAGRASASIRFLPAAPCRARLDADAARIDPRLRGAVAQADRAGHRPAFRRYRRRRRRPERGRNALFAERPCRAPPPTDREDAAHLDSSFLRQPALAERRRAVQAWRPVRQGSGQRDGRGQQDLSLSDQGIERTAIVERRARGGTGRFPHDRIFALARPGAPIDRDDPNGRRRACSSC